MSTQGRLLPGPFGSAVCLAVFALAALLGPACQDEEAGFPSPTASPTPALSPSPTPAPPASPTPAAGIALPEGFLAYEFAKNLSQPTSLAFDDRGALFVAERGGGAEARGQIKVLRDTDDDGIADRATTFAQGFEGLHGIAFAPDGTLYASHEATISALPDHDGDDKADAVADVIAGLPWGRHQNNGIAFGPDGNLYITSGSTCNVCQEPDERSAAILRADFDGSNLEVYARGLRNAYDLTFTPDGHLWATDNGADPPTVVDAPDELNLIVEGGDYGWPRCHGNIESEPGGCQNTQRPLAEFEPYSSSDGIVYYDGDNFPPEYRGNFFVAQWGSNPSSPRQTGRKLVRVIDRRLEPGPVGRPPVQVEDFATGFDHPLDVAIDAAGALYVADFGQGKIYRILWVGLGG